MVIKSLMVHLTFLQCYLLMMFSEEPLKFLKLTLTINRRWLSSAGTRTYTCVLVSLL